jgi:hypothetical protein
MSEATAETHVNGTAPVSAAPAGEDCADCVTSGEKMLATLAILFGVFIVVMGIDMFAGGKVGGWITERTSG